MSSFGTLIATGALIVSFLCSNAGHATPPERPAEPEKRIEREFKEGFEKIFRAFDLLLRSVPQYAAPEVLDNGDIVIRRKPPRPYSERDDPPSRRDDRI
jgi:hypothetical protein